MLSFARILLFAPVLVPWLIVPAFGGPFTALYVFGDSLSDVGNLSDITGGIYPGPSYYNGRTSNGPTFIEGLSTSLGLGASTPSRMGGKNFAFAGARTTGTGGIEGIFIQDVDEQVTSFLAGPAADPNALYLVFAGANDLVAGIPDLDTPVNRLATDIDRLYNDGARKFLIPNLPLLGLTPRYNDSAQKQFMNDQAASFNDKLDNKLDSLELIRPDIQFFRFDIETQFSEIINDPSYFGFANAMDEAAPGLQPGASNYNSSQIVAQPNTYLFWDDLHPTAAGHALLAEGALRALLPPGDYNRDWVVDIRDYILWRDTLGSTTALQADADRSRAVDAGDYAVWSANFATSFPGGLATTARVPEPGYAWLIALCCVLWRSRLNQC